MQPFFSIIIPTYNREILLSNAITSVLEQSYTNFEIVIINDNSQDKTFKYLNSIFDKRVKVIHNKVNLHKGASRNIGIKESNGQYICFLDDDDYFLSNHLEVLSDKIKENQYSESFFYTQVFLKKDNIIKKHPRIEYAPNESYVSYILFNWIPTNSVCIHSNILKKYRFNETIKIGQDMELWCRIVAEYPVVRINEYTSVMVWHGENSSSKKNPIGIHKLHGLKILFRKKNIKKLVPRKIRNKSLSNSYFLISEYYEEKGAYLNMSKNLILSYFYNRKSNRRKTIIVMLVYNFPLFGIFIKRIISIMKKV